MYGFANDSEKEEYIRELIGPRLDSSFVSSSVYSFFFLFSLSSSFFFFLSFIFRLLYWLLIGADGPPRPAEIRRSPAWKSWERVPRIKRIIILISACHRRIIHACPRRISYGIDYKSYAFVEVGLFLWFWKFEASHLQRIPCSSIFFVNYRTARRYIALLLR